MMHSVGVAQWHVPNSVTCLVDFLLDLTIIQWASIAFQKAYTVLRHPFALQLLLGLPEFDGLEFGAWCFACTYVVERVTLRLFSCAQSDCLLKLAWCMTDTPDRKSVV